MSIILILNYKIMKVLMSLLILCFLMNCTSDDTQERFNYDVRFDFSIKDGEGNDLLDPESPNSFDGSKIKLFYLISGELEEVYDGSLDNPRNFLIFQQGGDYNIRVFVNHSETEEIPKTYVRWNETDTDTISCEIYRTNTLVKVEKVWLNDELIWLASENITPYYEIIK